VSDKPHLPHWRPGAATKAVLADQEGAERFAHIAYGEVVKHFGLGTTHTFISWDQLSQDAREKWIAALTEVRQDLKEVEENPVNQTQTH
jgi:GH24 family phage-related lysozyme (muramidase)